MYIYIDIDTIRFSNLVCRKRIAQSIHRVQDVGTLHPEEEHIGRKGCKALGFGALFVAMPGTPHTPPTQSKGSRACDLSTLLTSNPPKTRLRPTPEPLSP